MESSPDGETLVLVLLTVLNFGSVILGVFGVNDVRVVDLIVEIVSFGVTVLSSMGVVVI